MNYTPSIELAEWRCGKCHRFYMAEKYLSRCAICSLDEIETLRSKVNQLERSIRAYRAFLKRRRHK